MASPAPLKELMEQAAVSLPERSEDRAFAILSAQDILSRPPKQFLVDNLIGVGDAVIFYGPGKSGKSFVVLDLCAALIRGCTFANQFNVRAATQVLYCYAEGRSGMTNRISALKGKWGLTDEELSRLKFVENVPQLFDTDSALHVSKLVDHLSTNMEYRNWLDGGLLIIDTLTRAAIGSNENHASDVSVIVDALDRAKQTLNCSALCVHHSNYQGTLRGSTNLPASFDAMFLIKREGGDRLFKCDVAKDADEGEDLRFSLSRHVWIDDEGRESSSCYVKWLGVDGKDSIKPRGWQEELVEVLRLHARTESEAKTAEELKVLTKREPSAKSIRDHLAPLAESPQSCVQFTLKASTRITAKGERAGKRAAAFFWNAERESSV